MNLMHKLLYPLPSFPDVTSVTLRDRIKVEDTLVASAGGKNEYYANMISSLSGLGLEIIKEVDLTDFNHLVDIVLDISQNQTDEYYATSVRQKGLTASLEALSDVFGKPDQLYTNKNKVKN